MSLRDIAQEAGVSRMAVSLALRHSPQIGENTRLKIQRVARRLGYRPDPQVSRLMSQIRKNRRSIEGSQIAYITSGDKPGNWRGNYTLRSYWEGARARAEEAGYTLAEYWLDDPAIPPARLSSILYARGVPAILLAPPHRLMQAAHIEHGLELSRFSVVEIADSYAPGGLYKALHDHHAGIEALMEHLTAVGYRRIGLALLRHHDLAVNHRWQAAYRMALQTMKLPKIEPLILPHADGVRLLRWVEQKNVEVVISATPLFAQTLEAGGARIPDDVAYADLDLDPSDGSGQFGGVDQNSKRIGMAAVESLISQIQLGQKGLPEIPVSVLVQGRVVPGRSMPGRR